MFSNSDLDVQRELLIFILSSFVSLSSVDESESHRGSRLKRSTGFPPVTPNACVKDTVRSLLFDQIWSEVISILQPILTRIKENASQGDDMIVYVHVRVPV